MSVDSLAREIARGLDMPGEHGLFLSNTSFALDRALDLNELLGILGIVPEAGAIASIATALAPAAIIMGAVGNLLALVNAWETGKRLFAYRASASAMTAWAFDHNAPEPSERWLSNVAEWFPEDVEQLREIWKTAVAETFEALNGRFPTHCNRGLMKALLRAGGSNDPAQFHLALLRGYESEFQSWLSPNPIELRVWRANYAIEYGE